METVITRDTDIIREYLAALAERERSLSPFARIAATVKLAQLRRELDAVQLETTDEDSAALRREVNERISRTFLRRFVSHTWGARLSIFLLLVLGQQIALAFWLLATMLFVKFAAVPKWWNPVYPREEPVLLYIFAFLFFAATPMLALQSVFAGRYFRSIRKTLPATLLIFALSGLGVYLIFRQQPNPIARFAAGSSMGEITKQLGVGKVENYDNWVKESWLLRDQKFRRDYESYLRNGPGRWITSRFDSTNDAAWTGSLPFMQEYVESGQDIEGFRQWLQYYLDRNRIYSTDRTEQEVMALTGEVNRGYLGVWQLEPFLKERDERVYKAYLGKVNRRMRTAGLIEMGVLTLVFLACYLISSRKSAKTQPVRREARNVAIPQTIGEGETIEDIPPAPSEQSKPNFSFPEREDIKTSPFFDTPFEILSKVHRSFMRVAVYTCILTFTFWAVVFAIWMASSTNNPKSQIELMRSNLLIGGPADESEFNRSELISANVVDPTRVELSSATMNDLSREARLRGLSFEETLELRMSDLGSRLDENEYRSDKQVAGQSESITRLRSDLDFLRSLSSQFQQTTSALPTQLAELSTRATAAEARAGEALGQATGTRTIAESIEGQLNQKLQQVESRAARVAEQIGKVEEQASLLATRTESLEKELDRRARQIEARTEELGERTTALKEREERLTRLQRAAFNAILVDIRSDVDDLDRRTQPNASRALSAAESQGVAEAVNARINALASELREMNTEQAKQMLAQLEELSRRVEQISSRVR